MARRQILAYRGVPGPVAARLRQYHDLHEWPKKPREQEAFLLDTGPRIEAVVTGGTEGLPNELMDRLPSLKLVSCHGVGYEGVDGHHAARRGVIVTHTPHVLDDEVANTAVALVLAVVRRIVAYDRYVRNGSWKREGGPPHTRGLAGRTVGMVGFGRIGLAIARKLEVFGCTIVYHARNARTDVEYRHYPDLKEMARDSEILVVTLPGGKATQRLIGREVIDALGPEGTLINIGRGSVVDEPEMVAALKEGRLGAAGLDVFEDEPNVPAALIAMDNVVLLPHVGSATVETRGAMAALVVGNIVSWFDKGKALTPIPECRHLQE